LEIPRNGDFLFCPYEIENAPLTKRGQRRTYDEKCLDKKEEQMLQTKCQRESCRSKNQR
jgi:hypothetical protein